jgi:SAM-dependent methyltransferase
MARARSKFAGGDQDYLRDVQYSGSDRLLSRARLHARYSTAETPWFDWVGSKLELTTGSRVLEVGCGAGWLWERSTMHVPEGVALTLADLSPGMVAEAVPRVVATGRFAAVSGEVADAQTLPFENGSFDRVIANHMLYHLPDPGRGVAELARVVDPRGRVVVATNGRRHMRELWAIRAAVFGLDPVDQTVDVFGIESGFPILRECFAEVAWTTYHDELRCTRPDDVIAYLCSTPPVEDATYEQQTTVEKAVNEAFTAASGVMIITKDTGCFVCTRPLSSTPETTHRVSGSPRERRPSLGGGTAAPST